MIQVISKNNQGDFLYGVIITTATPVLTLAQATSQGFIPGITQPLPPQPPPQHKRSNIYNTGGYGKVGINTTTPQGALEIFGYNNSYRIKFGTTLSTGTPYGANRIYSNGLLDF